MKCEVCKKEIDVKKTIEMFGESPLYVKTCSDNCYIRYLNNDYIHDKRKEIA